MQIWINLKALMAKKSFFTATQENKAVKLLKNSKKKALKMSLMQMALKTITTI